MTREKEGRRERKRKGRRNEGRRTRYDVLNILKVRPHLNWNVFEIIRLPCPPFCPRFIALPITSALHSTDWFEYPQLFRPPPSDSIPAILNSQELSREFEIAAPILLADLERQLEGTVNDSLIAGSGRLKICNR